MEIAQLTYPLLQDKAYVAVVPPGLTVRFIPRVGFSKSYAVFMTHYGSNDNAFVVPGKAEITTVPDGIAHFLEHQMFAKSWGDAFTKFAAWGADPNAFTGWTYTGYLFSTTDNFLECLRFLVNFVQDPYFTVQGTEKEKGIIEQEIRMYEDDPNWQVYFNLLTAMYQYHPVRKDIAGTAESVRSITKAQLDDCYNTFYHPSNMVLVVAGDVDPAQVIDAVAEELQKKNLKPQGEIKRVYPTEPESNREQSVLARMSVTTPLFALGFKDATVGERGDALLSKQITTDLALHAFLGKSSDLYNSLYDQGLIGRGFSFGYTGHPDHGYSVIQGESKDPAEVRRFVLQHLTQLIGEGISNERFELCRKVLWGEFLRQLNSVESVANAVAQSYFDDIDYLRFPEILQSITLDSLNQRLREHFSPKRAAFSTVLPS